MPKPRPVGRPRELQRPVTVAVRLPESLAKRLDRWRAKHKLSRSAAIRQIVDGKVSP